MSFPPLRPRQGQRRHARQEQDKRQDQPGVWGVAGIQCSMGAATVARAAAGSAPPRSLVPTLVVAAPHATAALTKSMLRWANLPLHGELPPLDRGLFLQEHGKDQQWKGRKPCQAGGFIGRAMQLNVQFRVRRTLPAFGAATVLSTVPIRPRKRRETAPGEGTLISNRSSGSNHVFTFLFPYFINFSISRASTRGAKSEKPTIAAATVGFKNHLSVRSED